MPADQVVVDLERLGVVSLGVVEVGERPPGGLGLELGSVSGSGSGSAPPSVGRGRSGSSAGSTSAAGEGGAASEGGGAAERRTSEGAGARATPEGPPWPARAPTGIRRSRSRSAEHRPGGDRHVARRHEERLLDQPLLAGILAELEGKGGDVERTFVDHRRQRLRDAGAAGSCPSPGTSAEEAAPPAPGFSAEPPASAPPASRARRSSGRPCGRPRAPDRACTS